MTSTGRLFNSTSNVLGTERQVEFDDADTAPDEYVHEHVDFVEDGVYFVEIGRIDVETWVDETMRRGVDGQVWRLWRVQCLNKSPPMFLTTPITYEIARGEIEALRQSQQ